MWLFIEKQRKSNQVIREKFGHQKTRDRGNRVASDWGEISMREQWIGERVIGEQANLGASDRGVNEKIIQ